MRLDNGKKIWKKRLKPTNKEEKISSIEGAGVAVYNKKVYATTGFGAVFALVAKPRCSSMLSKSMRNVIFAASYFTSMHKPLLRTNLAFSS